jgi:tetratricopeptide (TPR) repeat protein
LKDNCSSTPVMGKPLEASSSSAEGPLTHWLRRSAVAQAMALAGLAFLLRALHLRFIAGSPLFQVPTGDEFEHWDLAGKLAAGNWLGHGLGPYFRPPLFAYFLALLRVLTGGSLPFIHLILALLDAATVGVIYLTARRVWPRRTALIGAGSVAVYWPLLYFSATLNKESFAIHLQAWMLLALVIALRGRRRRRIPWRPLMAAGLMAGLGLLCRPSLALPLIGVLAALALLTYRRGAGLGRALLPPAIVAALALGVLIPLAWRNLTVGGAPVLYSTNGWLNLYFANNGEGVSWQEYSPGIGWDLLVERSKIDGGVVEGDYAGINAFWRRQFLEYLRRQPASFLKGIAAKSFAVLNAREVAVTNNFHEMARLSPVQRWLPGTGLLLPLALVGMAAWWGGKPRRPSRRDACTLLLIFALLQLLATALVFPVTRDRLPAMAVLLLFVGPGVRALRILLANSECNLAITGVAVNSPAVSLRESARRRRGERLVLLIALLVAVTVVWWPLPDTALSRHEAWTTEVNRGNAFAELWDREHQPQELLAAIAANERALRIRPEGLQPLMQLPPLYWQAGRREDALAAQERLVARLRREYPRNAHVRARELNMTGRLALQAAQPRDAEAAAREWRGLGVRLPEALDLEAVALAAEGKRAAARAVAAERLRLAPKDPASARLLHMLEALPQARARGAGGGTGGARPRPDAPP